jgi:hypothetical protein
MSQFILLLNTRSDSHRVSPAVVPRFKAARLACRGRCTPAAALGATYHGW